MATRDPRDARIAELERRLSAALARIEQQDARIAELEAQLRRTSRNTSQPPSTDPPGMPPRKSEPTGRKPGGQPGHKGRKRELLPPDKVTEVVAVPAPERCTGCNGPLLRLEGAPPARVHQVVELLRIVPEVKQYELHAGWCAGCNDWRCAPLPEGVPEGNFGPRLTGFIALATGRFRLSKRRVQELLEDVLGVELALGSVSNLEQLVSSALAAPVSEARAYMRTQPAVHQDETGWWQKHARAWLWVASTATVAVFLIVKSRGKAVAQTMLGQGFRGTLISDRWCAYNWVHALKRQVCWAHLVREFEGFVERGGEAKRLGELLLAEAFVMFEWWHLARDGLLTRATFQRRMRPLMREVERLLAEAAEVCPKKVAGTAREILKRKDALWTFVYTEAVEPTNNLAERDLRHSVIWRKTSFGTQSEDGSRFVERILTAVMSLRKQERNVLDYLTEALEALLHRAPAPSLLPGT
ncbi:IS66 family transposase [Corallococcus sp. CA053C]|uniref:IS66 family transposase n=1 Tax=Corallococcus sp. CA053C TaxID=2316732 RepID=UPI000EA149AF|nr:IS66 family transposase [Corallococcus sp. CA053C]RKH03383.1 IS66 family transposase [Corallococcus sp. CA053C]